MTVKAIAEAVGLSQPAVSQVLNGTGRISAATRQRVLMMADGMGYRPNAAARAVVTRKTKQVGVLILNNPADPDTFPHTYFTILGMNMALETAGYVLCMVRIGDVEHSVEGHSRVFREHVLDGVIVTTNLPDSVANRIQQLVPACIWADTNRWGETHCVRRDEFAVGRMAAQAAAAAGYKKIIFLTEELNAGGMPNHYSHMDRNEGIASVCRREKLSLDIIYQRWDWTPTFSEVLLSKLTPDTAVIATDTFRARMVQQTAALSRILIGQSFGLVCCDNLGSALSTWPDLAGVIFDRIELGRKAAEMMLSLLEDQHAQKSSLLANKWHPGSTLGSLR